MVGEITREPKGRKERGGTHCRRVEYLNFGAAGFTGTRYFYAATMEKLDALIRFWESVLRLE